MVCEIEKGGHLFAFLLLIVVSWGGCDWHLRGASATIALKTKEVMIRLLSC